MTEQFDEQFLLEPESDFNVSAHRRRTHVPVDHINYSEQKPFCAEQLNLVGYINGKIHSLSYSRAIIFPVTLDSQRPSNPPATIIGFGKDFEDLEVRVRELEAASRAGKRIVWPVNPQNIGHSDKDLAYRLVGLPYVQEKSDS